MNKCSSNWETVNQIRISYILRQKGSTHRVKRCLESRQIWNRLEFQLRKWKQCDRFNAGHVLGTLQTCYLEKVDKISNPIKFKVVCFKLKGDLKSCGELFRRCILIYASRSTGQNGRTVLGLLCFLVLKHRGGETNREQWLAAPPVT